MDIESQMKRFFTAILALLVITAASLQTSHVIADEVTDDTNLIIIDTAHATAVEAGGDTQIEFRVTNIGRRPLNLQAVQSDFATGSRIVVSDPFDGPFEVDDLSLLHDETLDLASSHIRVELLNLTQSIETGSTVEFELVFRQFITAGRAHVHQ